MEFDLTIPGRIVFGAGKAAEAGEALNQLGRRALVVTGRDPWRAGALFASLEAAGVDSASFTVDREPDMSGVREGVAAARDERADFVVGMGGGAVLDTAKAIAALATAGGDVLDYVEIIGAGRRLESSPLPFVAIPTTAGSGAEATWNSVIASREHRVKVSLRDRSMLADIVIVDPQSTYTVPPDVTATTGMDALTQLIEAFVTLRAGPVTDALCLEGLQRAARSLHRACAVGDDPSAREDMAVAALLSGIVLANAGLGAVHGIAGPLGGMIVAPHGALCAALLPGVIAQNISALRERMPQSPALARYATIAAILSGPHNDPALGGPAVTAGPETCAALLTSLASELGIPPLARYGLDRDDIPELVAKSLRASSMKGNPVLLTEEEVTRAIESAL